MAKIWDYKSSWRNDIDLPTVYSVIGYERYGDVKIVNDKFKFVVAKTQEMGDDFLYCYWDFIDAVEKLFILSKLNVLDNVGLKILKQTTKRELQPINYYPHWQADLDYLKQNKDVYGDDRIIEIINSSNYIPNGFSLIFQIRRDWQIESGYFCDRCGREGFNYYSDFRTTVFGRFGCGIIPKKYLRDYKTILFRKFN